jgi:hypothetical protein
MTNDIAVVKIGIKNNRQSAFFELIIVFIINVFLVKRGKGTKKIYI